MKFHFFTPKIVFISPYVLEVVAKYVFHTQNYFLLLWIGGFKAETKIWKLTLYAPKEKFGQNSLLKIKFFLTKNRFFEKTF
jgi:hypothetical protein